MSPQDKAVYLNAVPLFILASYRGDVGDRTGIPGSSLFTFNQVGEPVLSALRVPYRIARMPMAMVLRAHTLSETCGYMKALIGGGQ